MTTYQYPRRPAIFTTSQKFLSEPVFTQMAWQGARVAAFSRHFMWAHVGLNHTLQRGQAVQGVVPATVRAPAAWATGWPAWGVPHRPSSLQGCSESWGRQSPAPKMKSRRSKQTPPSHAHAPLPILASANSHAGTSLGQPRTAAYLGPQILSLGSCPRGSLPPMARHRAYAHRGSQPVWYINQRCYGAFGKRGG